MGDRAPQRSKDRSKEDSKDALRSEAAETSADVAAFLDEVSALEPRRRGPGGRGRLIVALDATMSRQPTWDAAMSIQGEMFDAAAERGGLEVELVFFRGLNECRASGWVADARALGRKMSAVSCRAGRTQIMRTLEHVAKRAEAGGVDAFVYVGDAFEENIDLVADVAGQLGVRGVKGFLFQEGGDPGAKRAFTEIARLTGGAYFRFDENAAETLRALLGAVAAYASGGFRALEDYAGGRGGAASALVRALPAPE
ncbi:MAG: hypothetical protein PVI23_02090 [Maricaulaceae bacterium]